MSNTITLPLDAFDSGAGLESNDEVKRLRSTHELWQLYSPLWAFYLSAFEGGRDFACKDNLHTHARETAVDFERRIQRLDNTNYCEPLVTYFTNFIFAESIDRSGGSNKDFFNTFVKDVSLRGENIDDFSKQVCDDAQIFGMSYIIVDTPAVPEGGTLSKQAQEDNNIRPYWVLVQPDEITDWVVDAFDRFEYAKRKQCVCELVGGSRTEIELYTEYYPDHYTISRIDITKKDKPKYLGSVDVLNALDEIPIRVARYRRSKKHPHMGTSFLVDFADNNKKILNLSSLLDEFLFKQCFNMLAREVDSTIPTQEQQEGTIGTANVLDFPKGAKVPSYVSPPVDPAHVLQDERGRIIRQMYLRASQEVDNELSNGEKSSGFSQSQSFSKTVPFIANRAEMLERVETELMSLTMEMMSKTWDGKIKYKDRYELTSLTSALTQLLVLIKDLQVPSETFIKAQLKRMVNEFDGKLSVEDQNKIDDEIDKMDFKSWMDAQKTALVGAPPTSPGAQQKPKQDVTISQRDTGHTVKTSATTKLQA